MSVKNILVLVIFFIGFNLLIQHVPLDINPMIKLILGALLFGALTNSFIEYNKDNFTFEVTPGKNCVLGPYTWQSKDNPCNKLPPEQIARFACPNGYFGMPNKFEYISAINGV